MASYRDVMKNFKLSVEEWDRYKMLALEWPLGSDFSSICRMGLEVLCQLAQPNPLGTGVLEVKTEMLEQVKHLRRQYEARKTQNSAPSPATKKKPAGKTAKKVSKNGHVNGKTKKVEPTWSEHISLTDQVAGDSHGRGFADMQNMEIATWCELNGHSLDEAINLVQRLDTSYPQRNGGNSLEEMKVLLGKTGSKKTATKKKGNKVLS